MRSKEKRKTLHKWHVSIILKINWSSKLKNFKENFSWSKNNCKDNFYKQKVIIGHNCLSLGYKNNFKWWNKYGACMGCLLAKLFPYFALLMELMLESNFLNIKDKNIYSFGKIQSFYFDFLKFDFVLSCSHAWC